MKILLKKRFQPNVLNNFLLPSSLTSSNADICRSTLRAIHYTLKSSNLMRYFQFLCQELFLLRNRYRIPVNAQLFIPFSNRKTILDVRKYRVIMQMDENAYSTSQRILDYCEVLCIELSISQIIKLMSSYQYFNSIWHFRLLMKAPSSCLPYVKNDFLNLLLQNKQQSPSFHFCPRDFSLS